MLRNYINLLALALFASVPVTTRGAQQGKWAQNNHDFLRERGIELHIPFDPTRYFLPSEVGAGIAVVGSKLRHMKGEDVYSMNKNSPLYVTAQVESDEGYQEVSAQPRTIRVVEKGKGYFWRYDQVKTIQQSTKSKQYLDRLLKGNGRLFSENQCAISITQGASCKVTFAEWHYDDSLNVDCLRSYLSEDAAEGEITQTVAITRLSKWLLFGSCLALGSGVAWWLKTRSGK